LGDPLGWGNDPDTSTMTLHWTTLTSEQISQFPEITITLDDGHSLVVSPKTYFKRVNDGERSLGVRDGRQTTLLGQVVMENYEVIFDRENVLLGFGPNDACGG